MGSAENIWIARLDPERVARVVEEKGEALKKMHHTEDVYFAIWLHALDRAVQRMTAMSYRDLEDWDYWSAYAGDMNPRDAAEDMLDYMGWGYEGMGE